MSEQQKQLEAIKSEAACEEARLTELKEFVDRQRINLSGRDFLNTVTEVLQSDLQRWRWDSPQFRTEKGWQIGVHFLGTGSHYEIEKNDGEPFMVRGDAPTHRLEGLLNGLVRDEAGNMVQPAPAASEPEDAKRFRYAYAFADGDLTGVYPSKSAAAFEAVQFAPEGQSHFTVHTLEYWATSDEWVEAEGVEPDLFRIEDGKAVQVIAANVG